MLCIEIVLSGIFLVLLYLKQIQFKSILIVDLLRSTFHFFRIHRTCSIMLMCFLSLLFIGIKTFSLYQKLKCVSVYLEESNKGHHVSRKNVDKVCVDLT